MREILQDLKAIIETVPSVNKVSHGKPSALSAEDTFTAVYIVPDATSYQLFKQGTNADSYNQVLYVKLYVNTLNDVDELGYTYVLQDIIKALLSDTQLWTKVVDRDVVASTFDENGDLPRKAFELLVELKYRDSCA